MTTQKVIDILDRIIDEDWHVYTDDAIEALMIAKETMAKEIAVKPFNDSPFALIHTIGDQTKHCPNCGTPLIDKELGDYCPKCGQKIDWEENGEDGNYHD